MFNSMMKGYNEKLSNLLCLSVNRSNQGFIGRNVSWISASWRCGFQLLKDNSKNVGDVDASARAEAIRELTLCQNGLLMLNEFNNNELRDLTNFIAMF